MANTSNTLENAVNALLNKPELIEDPDFIELMYQVYTILIDIDDHSMEPDAKDLVVEVLDAAGEFVPADYTGKT